MSELREQIADYLVVKDIIFDEGYAYEVSGHITDLCLQAAVEAVRMRFSELVTEEELIEAIKEKLK